MTLIEMLVVVAIIGILLSILLPSLASAREKTKTASLRFECTCCKPRRGKKKRNSFPGGWPQWLERPSLLVCPLRFKAREKEKEEKLFLAFLSLAMLLQRASDPAARSSFARRDFIEKKSFSSMSGCFEREEKKILRWQRVEEKQKVWHALRPLFSLSKAKGRERQKNQRHGEKKKVRKKEPSTYFCLPI